MKNTKHTLTLPRLAASQTGNDYELVDANNCDYIVAQNLTKEDADGIVQACNGYVDAVRALERLVSQLDDGPRSCYGRNSVGQEDWKGSTHERIEAARAVLSSNPLPADPVFAALEMANQSLKTLADAAGDAPEWNEGGHAYESLLAINAALSGKTLAL